MPDHPLAEVFGFPVDNHSNEALRHRKHRLCPYNNKVPNCTKDKANSPLGVCSIFEGDGTTITCPVRFREDWMIADDAADFFFPQDAQWTSLTEARLKDENEQSAGNIDVVLVSYDDKGKLSDFGSLEVQAVYISGNVRRPFESYMEDPQVGAEFNWRGESNYPRADYLSSSRKRLVPQRIFKGGILHAWGKKSAVALTRGFYETLPPLAQVPKDEAEIAWLVYDLQYNEEQNKFHMTKCETVYTRFTASLVAISQAKPGSIADFENTLQSKLDEALVYDERNPPDAPPLDKIFE
jgi:hypothetical protein